MTDTPQSASSPAETATAPENRPTRRRFLVRAGLGATGVVALGTFLARNPIRRAVYHKSENITLPYYGRGTEAELWFEILNDNRVRFHSPKVEMGQGLFTGLAQVIADELDVTVDQLDVEAASTSRGVVDALSTGGSLSVAGLWQPLRELSATMREMLKTAAATQLGAEISTLSTAAGVVSSPDKSLTYAEVASHVSEWTIPAIPPLRPLAEYKSVGKPIPRIDLAPKIYGDPIFGMDAELPGMLHAAVIRPEHVGGVLKRVDASRCAAMPGVVQVVERDDWVGVVAQSFPQALAAKRVLEVEWDVPHEWTEEEIRSLLRVGNGDEMVTQKQGSQLDENDPELISLEFTTPIGAHAQIEPNGAVADVSNGKATVILSTQVVGITQRQVAAALGMNVDDVNIVPTFLGGGFGRRLATPHAVQAAQMSQAVGKPVKYFFTRKEEFQHDTFRPPTHHVMRGKLNSAGMLDAIEHHYASGNVAIGSPILPGPVQSIIGTDFGAMRGGNIQYDLVPSHRAVQWHTTLPFATSWWRGLGLLANTFAIESFLDEVALQSGQDPVAFRLTQISDAGNGKRLKEVIKKVAAAANYRDEPRSGRAQGIACSIDSGAPCAQVAEVSVEHRQIKVHKVTCAFDCGLVVNPDQVRAQCEGCIIMGISAAMHEKMTLRDGQLYPTIYGPYDMALMRHAPRDIDIHLIEGADRPLPVGEPPLGPIAPAVANAVRRLTGQRLTHLPLRLS